MSIFVKEEKQERQTQDSLKMRALVFTACEEKQETISSLIKQCKKCYRHH